MPHTLTKIETHTHTHTIKFKKLKKERKKELVDKKYKYRIAKNP